MKELRITFTTDVANRVVVTLKQGEAAVYCRSADMYPSRTAAEAEMDTLMTQLCADVLNWLTDATINQRRHFTGAWQEVERS